MQLSRRSFLAAVGAGAAASLAGCAAGTSGSAGSASGPAEGKISLLTPIYEGTTGKKLLEGSLLPAFRKAHPKVTVDVDYTTYDALNEKITTSLAGGLLADVLMLGVGWVPPFAYKKVLAPLPERLAKANDYDPRVLDPSRYQGSLYALPVVIDTRFVAYRKDLFEQAGIKKTPTSWDELRQVAKELTGPGRHGIDPFSIDLRQCWETFLFANGGTLFDRTGRKVAFDDDAGVGALQFFLDLIADRSASYAAKSDDGRPSLLQQGKAAMMVCNNDLWLDIAQQSPDLAENDKIGTFVLRNERPAILQGGTLVAQSAHSKAPAAAQALVAYLSSPKATLAAAQQRGAVVADRSLRSSSYVKQNPFVSFAVGNLDKAYSEGGSPAWLEVREKVAPTLETAIVGHRTAKQAIDDLAKTCSDAIARL